MNRLLIAALAVVACVPLLARAATIADPVVPKGLSDTPMSAPTPLAESAPPPRPMKNEIAASHDADARQCLNLPTNRQIMACAERYRSHVHRTSAKVAKAAPSDKPKEEVVKAADTAKPAPAAKAPDTSKAAASTAPAATTAKPPAAAPTKTSDVINLPPLKPAAAEPTKPAAAAPSKAPEPAKK